MKSNPKDERCKKCYKECKGALLFCEATGICKYEYKGDGK